MITPDRASKNIECHASIKEMTPSRSIAKTVKSCYEIRNAKSGKQLFPAVFSENKLERSIRFLCCQFEQHLIIIPLETSDALRIPRTQLRLICNGL